MKHTPGPWVVSYGEGRESDRIYGIYTEASYPSSRIGDTEYFEQTCIVETDGGFYPPEKSDALLIAAAPCLLKALQQIIKGVPDTWPAVEQAKSAIRKATGDD